MLLSSTLRGCVEDNNYKIPKSTNTPGGRWRSWEGAEDELGRGVALKPAAHRRAGRAGRARGLAERETATGAEGDEKRRVQGRCNNRAKGEALEPPTSHLRPPTSDLRPRTSHLEPLTSSSHLKPPTSTSRLQPPACLPLRRRLVPAAPSASASGTERKCLRAPSAEAAVLM